MVEVVVVVVEVWWWCCGGGGVVVSVWWWRGGGGGGHRTGKAMSIDCVEPRLTSALSLLRIVSRL